MGPSACALRSRGLKRILVQCALGGLIGVYTWRTLLRNNDWHNNISLWRATVNELPGESTPMQLWYRTVVYGRQC